MLAIQQISTNNYNKPSKVQFKGWEDTIKDGKETVREVKDTLDGIMADTEVPDRLKTPVKWGRVIANAAMEGLAVGGSVLLLANLLKKPTVINTVGKLKPMAGKIKNGAISAGSFIKDLLVKGFNKASATSWGKKLLTKATEFLGTDKGAALLKYAKNIGNKISSIAQKVLKPFKNLTFDKVTNGLAATLGLGCGATGAYEASMNEENIPNEFEE